MIDFDKLIKTIVVFWFAVGVLAMAAGGGLIYVAYHFISKWW